MGFLPCPVHCIFWMAVMSAFTLTRTSTSRAEAPSSLRNRTFQVHALKSYSLFRLQGSSSVKVVLIRGFVILFIGGIFKWRVPNPAHNQLSWYASPSHFSSLPNGCSEATQRIRGLIPDVVSCLNHMQKNRPGPLPSEWRSVTFPTCVDFYTWNHAPSSI